MNHHDSPSPWGQDRNISLDEEIRDEESASRRHLAQKVIIGAIVVMIAGGGVALYVFNRRLTAPSVSIQFINEDGKLYAGKVFSLDVVATNMSDETFKNATLSLYLPDGAYFAGQGNDVRYLERVIGDLGPGSFDKEVFSLITIGNAPSVKRLQATFSYSGSKNPNYQFEKDAAFDVSVEQPALALFFDAPQTTFSGQPIALTVRYVNTTDRTFSGVHLALTYPPSFQFEKASSGPSTSNNEWALSDVPGGGSGTITVNGLIIGADNSVHTVSGALTGVISSQQYQLAAQSASVTIASAPLAIAITANGSADTIASPGSQISYVISYRNNSAATLKDVVVSARLSGAVFDFSSPSTNGSYNSVDNSFSWLVANTPALASIDPGGSGQVQLTIGLKSALPVRSAGDKNFTVHAEARIVSPTVPQGAVASTTYSVAQLDTRVAGGLFVASRGYWKDAPSKILNAGPYPPKINTPTQYTIHWIIQPVGDDMKNIHVSAFLQSGSSFTGLVKSTLTTSPAYNANTGEVTWDIPQLPANYGFGSSPAEAIFQIENTPASTQAGRDITILSPTVAQASDQFTNNSVTVTVPEVTTRLPDDAAAAPGADRSVRL